MDIHEWFNYKVKSLKEIVSKMETEEEYQEKIEKLSEEEREVEIEEQIYDNSPSNYELFVQFLTDLRNNMGEDRYLAHIIQNIMGYDFFEEPFHEKVRQFANIIDDYNFLEKISYSYGDSLSSVEVDYYKRDEDKVTITIPKNINGDDLKNITNSIKKAFKEDTYRREIEITFKDDKNEMDKENKK